MTALNIRTELARAAADRDSAREAEHLALDRIRTLVRRARADGGPSMVEMAAIVYPGGQPASNRVALYSLIGPVGPPRGVGASTRGRDKTQG